MRSPALLALLALSLAAAGQQRDQFKFSAQANLVIVNVTVRDRDGKPIEGLSRGDFQILEDGKPQTVSVFDFQKLTRETLAPAPPPLDKSLYVRPETPAPPPPAYKPGEIRYQDKRLLVLFFDFSGMPVADQIRAQEAALEFLARQMTASDLVSIMTFGTRLRVEQDFTDDREALGAVVRGLRIGEMTETQTEAADEDEEADDTNTLFVADETEFNIFNTDRKLSALETAVRNLGSLAEKKALVYFSSGVGKTGMENHSQLRSTINAAVRANVAFYPVDARGLAALPPGGDASAAGARGTGLFSGRSQRDQFSRFYDQQETLDTLAADTGGKALLDSNDLKLGITRAQQEFESYYILGYYSTNQAQDGRFRRIRVSVGAQPRAKLEYRPGYFAPKEFRFFNEDDKERQLEEALALGDPVTDLPLALEVNYFRMPNNSYFVPVAVKIPGSAIELAGKGSVELDFIGQVRDAKRRIAGNVRDAIRVKLDAAGAGELKRRRLYYDTGFTLDPGAYTIKFLAREQQTGRMGTFEAKFTVPDLNNENAMLRLSSVVFGSQREPVAAAVGSAQGRRNRLARLHPLVEEDKKLIPSVTHVFRRDQTLYVYFEAYDAGTPDPGSPSVAASLSFFAGDVKAFESAPLRVSQAAAGRRGVLPFRFQAPLAKLEPGRYTCQVNVIDELGRKFAFRRSPLVLLP